MKSREDTGVGEDRSHECFQGTEVFELVVMFDVAFPDLPPLHIRRTAHEVAPDFGRLLDLPENTQPILAGEVLYSLKEANDIVAAVGKRIINYVHFRIVKVGT